MRTDGYMIEAEYDGATLRVRGKNKPARIALAGQDHEGDVVIPADQIAEVTLKDASVMVNGNLRVSTVAGKTYQLHFRKKQAKDFRALADQLRR